MYDVVIVGGRCAGSSLAMLLARGGLDVLVVDRDELSSDKVNSTHLIWHAGVACLKKWGLLDRLLATNCPLQGRFMLDLGEIRLHSRVELRDCIAEGAVAPRRRVLDTLLQDEARAAGAEVRGGVSLTGLLRDGDRVCGVRISDATGGPKDIYARLVIGADGLNSTVAKMVGAQEYNTREKAEQVFFAYYSGVPQDEIEFYSRPGRMGFAWPTNDAQTVIGFCCRMADTGPFRQGGDQAFRAEMAAICPDLGRRMGNGRCESDMLTAGTRSFLRQATGPGWALTGDAGINMDPISAAGISNAFIQADMLSGAVLRGLSGGGLDDELAAFATSRDETIGPMYEFTSEMARLDPEPPAEVIQMFVGLAGSQADTDAYFGVFAQTVPVAEFFDPQNMARIISLAQPA